MRFLEIFLLGLVVFGESIIEYGDISPAGVIRFLGDKLFTLDELAMTNSGLGRGEVIRLDSFIL